MRERVDRLIDEVKTEYRRSLADETIKYDLSPEGDDRRREAAAKHVAMEEFITRLKDKMRKEL